LCSFPCSSCRRTQRSSSKKTPHRHHRPSACSSSHQHAAASPRPGTQQQQQQSQQQSQPGGWGGKGRGMGAYLPHSACNAKPSVSPDSNGMAVGWRHRHESGEVSTSGPSFPSQQGTWRQCSL
jgi:hypothetical protein